MKVFTVTLTLFIALWVVIISCSNEQINSRNKQNEFGAVDSSIIDSSMVDSILYQLNMPSMALKSYTFSELESYGITANNVNIIDGHVRLFKSGERNPVCDFMIISASDSLLALLQANTYLLIIDKYSKAQYIFILHNNKSNIIDNLQAVFAVDSCLRPYWGMKFDFLFHDPDKYFFEGYKYEQPHLQISLYANSDSCVGRILTSSDLFMERLRKIDQIYKTDCLTVKYINDSHEAIDNYFKSYPFWLEEAMLYPMDK
jgi:hypothetical protein